MDPLSHIEDAFGRALGLDPEEQRRFLEQLGEVDPELAREVTALLAADSSAGDFLGQPLVSLPQLSPAPEEPSPDERIGQVLGGYELTRVIGTGGMSYVYRGEKEGDGFLLVAAVKVIRSDAGTDEFAWRFVRERRLLAALRHPHIARLLDGGTTPDGRPFLVMEHVDGVPIDRYCRDRRLPVSERIRLFRGVCDAVAYAHRSLVVHRDLKPSNILVSPDGIPKLLDFGIAKVLDEAEEVRPSDPARNPVTSPAGEDTTVAGLRLLTPRYASPEQIRGEPTTTATDVYALGVLLYEILTDRSPYEEEAGSGSLEASIITQAPTRPSVAVRRSGTDGTGPSAEAWSRSLEGDLDHIVLRALEKSPEARYSSVELLDGDLERHLRGLPVRAHPDSPRYRLSKFVARNRAPVGLAAVLAVVLTGSTISTMIQLRKTAAERDRANREAEIAGRTASFLEELFRIADPSESRGQTITAREILDRGARTARATLGDEPELQARFLRSLGSVHASLGLYARADSLLCESMALYRRGGEEDEVEIASTLDLRAHVAKQEGRIPEAIELAGEALALREEHLGPNALPTAQSLNNLALLQTRMNRLDEAAALFERAVRIREQELGPNHLDGAATLHNMGNLYMRLGRFDDARSAYRRALDARLASGPADHPAVASAYSGLASIAIEEGRYAEAESLQTRSLEIKIQAYGETHDVVAVAWANLALVRKNLGDLGAARDASLRAIELLRGSLGPSHPHCASALFTLGQIESEMGNDDSALARVEEAHRIFSATLPPDHPDLAEATELRSALRLRTERTRGRPRAD